MPGIEGAPSATARRVAAYRLSCDRLDSPYGDAAADVRLARDVAGSDAAPPPEGGMFRHLRSRTTFFDRVVVNAMQRDVSQVLSVGAGYDGRALRYAKAGVRWWEVDHPDTQADKQARLQRLAIPAANVTFFPFDLRDQGLADALLAAGFQPDAPALILCEGLAVYLDVEVLEATLGELRALATVGTRLAISWRPRIDTPEQAARREQFEAGVAAWGEPARNHITAEDAGPWLARTRWRATEISERAQQAGFAMLAPIWAPSAATGLRASAGDVAAFMERMLYRTGAAGLGRHLEHTYGVRVAGVKELDLGVYAVDLGGRRWIARVFPASRSVAATRQDAALLSWLRAGDIPAEEPAAPDPVSLYEGQPTLVTVRAAGQLAAATTDVFSFWGEQLGRLHRLAPDAAAAQRPGGAWHHLALDGGLGEEATACADLLRAARHRIRPADSELYESLAADVSELEVYAHLPHAVGHADPVPRNLILGGKGAPTIIDWAGAGWFARIASLGCLMWAAAAAGGPAIQAAARGYRTAIEPDPAELDVLGQAMGTRPLVLAVWAFATGRQTLSDAVSSWQAQQSLVKKTQPRVVTALRS